MFEKVNPYHPDKVADRIAGALVDVAYERSENENPRIAVEVLLGHGNATVIIETSLGRSELRAEDVIEAVRRNAPSVDKRNIHVTIVPQDEHLASNQQAEIRCGDNGIFRGMPITTEQRKLSEIALDITHGYPYDGKYIINGDSVTVCQSNMSAEQGDTIRKTIRNMYGITGDIKINPLGEWTGGIDTDSGATNRKLGSDMGDAVTGGGLHGKDLSKADVSVNIFCHLIAQQRNSPVTACCAIGDKDVDVTIERTGKVMSFPYETIVKHAREYIQEQGGFEQFAAWGLI